MKTKIKKTLGLTLCLAACLAAVSASAQTTLFNFNFNETSGTNTYSATNGIFGTLGIGLVNVDTDPFAADPLMTNSAPAFSSDSPSGLPGDGSIAYGFIDAYYAGERINVQDPSGVVAVTDASGTNDFTFQCWVKFNTVPTDRSTLFDCNEPGLKVNIAILADRSLVMTPYGLQNDVSTSQKIVDDGQWHHIAIVHQDGVAVLFYIDGILRDTVPYTAGVHTGGPQPYFNVGGEVWDWPNLGSMVHPFVGNMDRMSLTRGIVAATNLDWTPIPGVAPAAPSLNSPKPAIDISWPTLPAGYILESTTNLADTNSWVNVANAPSATGPGAYYHYFGPSTSQQQYFRLIKP